MDFKSYNRSSSRKETKDFNNNSYFSDNGRSRSDNHLNIIINSFKPLVEKAHKQYVKDNYSKVVQKLENERSQFIQKKSDLEMIYEKYFNSSVPKLYHKPKQNKLKKIQTNKLPLKRKESFLIENKIIDKNDIFNNPCNRYTRICYTPEITTHKRTSFFEKEQNYQKMYEAKKDEMRRRAEKKLFSQFKASPGIFSGSMKIIQKNHLHQRLPLHLRGKELIEEKNLKIKSMEKSLKREYSAKILSKKNNFMENNLNLKDDINYSSNNLNINYNTNYSTNPYFSNDIANKNLTVKCNDEFARSKSYNSKDLAFWLDSNKNWLQRKEAKIENMKNLSQSIAREKEEKSTTFQPLIDKKSEYIAYFKKEQESPNKNIYDKLYSLHSKKKEKIQNLQMKYTPNFKPVINKFPKYLQNNSLQNQITKSLSIEEKDEDYVNFSSKAKANKSKSDISGTTRPASKNERVVCKESSDFDKFKKDVENSYYVNKNRNNFKNSKKEVEQFFLKMNEDYVNNINKQYSNL